MGTTVDSNHSTSGQSYIPMNIQSELSFSSTKKNAKIPNDKKNANSIANTSSTKTSSSFPSHNAFQKIGENASGKNKQFNFTEDEEYYTEPEKVGKEYYAEPQAETERGGEELYTDPDYDGIVEGKAIYSEPDAEDELAMVEAQVTVKPPQKSYNELSDIATHEEYLYPLSIRLPIQS